MTRPTLVFDGDCGFCSACARVIEARIPTSARVVPWQRADLAALGLTPEACTQALQWAPGEAGAAVESGSRAIGRLLVDAGSFWRLAGRVLLTPPGSWLAPPVYRWVARHRHQLPGGGAACAAVPAGRPAAP